MNKIDLGTQNGQFILVAKDDREEIKITLSLAEIEELSVGIVKVIEILKKEIEDGASL